MEASPINLLQLRVVGQQEHPIFVVFGAAFMSPIRFKLGGEAAQESLFETE